MKAMIIKVCQLTKVYYFRGEKYIRGDDTLNIRNGQRGFLHWRTGVTFNLWEKFTKKRVIVTFIKSIHV